VLLADPAVPDMNDLVAEVHADVRYDAAMALPPENLRTHDCGARSLGEHQELEEAFRKLLSDDVIRISAKS
jgi:hypothetical protein